MTPITRRRIRQLILPTAAAFTLLLYKALPYRSEVVESWYSRGLFKAYRALWDHTIGYLPMAVIYMVILAVIFMIYRAFANRQKPRWRTLVMVVIQLISTSILVFYWCWGFNYKRADFRSMTSISYEVPYEAYVEEEYHRILDTLVKLRSQMEVTDWDDLHVTNEDLRHDLNATFDVLGLPTFQKVRVRRLYPKGSLMHLSTAGVYLPFSGEGHIDPGLHPITHAFTMTHEMAHGYGWTGEDVCNFLAYLATTRSTSLYRRYSGYFGYWRYLRAQFFRQDRQYFRECYADLPARIEKDYAEILRYSDHYPNVMPRLRDLFYDNYLKSHGVSSGIRSYSEMILLTYQWQHRHALEPKRL